MLWIEHRHQHDAIKKEVNEAVRLYLGNRRGGYLMLPSEAPSRYDGFFIFDSSDGQMYKIIDTLNLPINSVTNTFSSADTGSARFCMPSETSSLVIEPKTNEPIELMMDIRKSYDLREWGRNYIVTEQGKKIILQYTKKTDSREDPSSEIAEYQLYAVIRHDGTHQLKQEWIRREYPYDLERGSGPSGRHVFCAASVKAKKLVISVSKQLEAAEKEAEEIFCSPPEANIEFEQVSDRPDINFAYNSATCALHNLIIKNGIIAGHPWFFQFWTRDEAIATGGLIASGRYDEAKKILFRELDHMLADGRITNQIPDGGLGSADGTGWCFLRLKQLADKGKLTKLEQTFLMAKVDYMLPKFNHSYFRDHLVFNSVKETWMDTDVDDSDQRDGARVEIQALELALNTLLFKITGQDGFLEVAKGIKERVRKEFWNGTILADGLGDFTIRPNIFIAYYAYPELLTADEWAKCFDTAIPALWLDWGGFATIDKSNPLFCNQHTGENNRSYHRGDSWYWINNLAAICMHRLDKTRYAYHIDRILRASTAEILWKGAIGSHSEISSAERSESKGCLSQAWSLATYMEFVKELYPDDHLPKNNDS